MNVSGSHTDACEYHSLAPTCCFALPPPHPPPSLSLSPSLTLTVFHVLLVLFSRDPPIPNSLSLSLSLCIYWKPLNFLLSISNHSLLSSMYLSLLHHLFHPSFSFRRISASSSSSSSLFFPAVDVSGARYVLFYTLSSTEPKMPSLLHKVVYLDQPNPGTKLLGTMWPWSYCFNHSIGGILLK